MHAYIQLDVLAVLIVCYIVLTCTEATQGKPKPTHYCVVTCPAPIYVLFIFGLK